MGWCLNIIPPTPLLLYPPTPCIIPPIPPFLGGRFRSCISYPHNPKKIWENFYPKKVIIQYKIKNLKKKFGKIFTQKKFLYNIKSKKYVLQIKQKNLIMGYR
jgi:hypothetical protein